MSELISSMEKVSVFGLGNWGTALAHHLACVGCDVLAWGVEPEVVASINQQHRNPLYLSGVELHSSVRATTDLAEACKREVHIFVVPSKFMGQVLRRMHIQPSTLFVSAVKGLDPETLCTPLQTLHHIHASVTEAVVFSGPSFAKDVALRRPCGLVAASKSETAARRAAELFTSDIMKVYLSSDPLGVELGGILKNVIALGVGVADGLGLGDSARAGLVTRGLAEMTRLAVAMGADLRTLSGLSGLGDLSMTATSDLSRNRTVGLRLGKGETLANIVASLGSVAEGVTTAPLVLKLASKYQVEMPISEHVQKLLSGEMGVDEIVKVLLSRPMRSEF